MLGPVFLHYLTAGECALRDCRREAGLSNVSSKIPLLRMDDLEVENSEVGRRLTGAGVAGGGGGAMGGSRCTITCVYAVPLSLWLQAAFM